MGHRFSLAVYVEHDGRRRESAVAAAGPLRPTQLLLSACAAPPIGRIIARAKPAGTNKGG